MQRFDRRLVTILLIVFVQIMGASMALPILPLYAQRQFDMSPEVITLLISVFFLAQFLAGPTIGRLSDRQGRLPVLIISQIGTVISFLMLALAGSVEVLFLARVLDGITGGNIIVARAYVTDITPRARRTEALGYIFAAFGLGFIIGPALGGILSSLVNEQFPFFVAAFAAAIVVALTWFTLDETVTPEQREANRNYTENSLKPMLVVRNYPLMMVLFVTFGGQFAFGLLQSTFALYGDAILFSGYDQAATDLGIGLLLSTIGLAQFLTQVVVLKPLLKYLSDAPLVVLGCFLRGISMYGFAIITTPYPAVISGAFYAMGTGLMIPPLQSLATDTVAEELRGGVQGLYQSAFSLGIIFSTALAGRLFAITPQTPYWVGGTIFMLVLIPSFVLLRWAQQAIQPDSIQAAAD